MAQIETTQVTLRLVEPNDRVATPDGEVEGKEILKALRTNKVWKRDNVGPYVSVMFDGQEFKFRTKADNKGKPFTRTVGPTVANALIRGSAVIVGNDKLTGPIAPYLIKIGTREISEGDARPVIGPTTCPVCFTDQKTLGRLARHLEKHKKDNPELFDPNEDVNDGLEESEPKLPTDGAEDDSDVGTEVESGE